VVPDRYHRFFIRFKTSDISNHYPTVIIQYCDIVFISQEEKNSIV
jgi:hypothetical protein